MLFREILKNEREKAKLTQGALGESLGVTAKAISSYEAGRTQPTIETLVCLANIFEVSLDYLLGRSNKEVQSFQEQHLVNLFRDLSDDNKEKVIAITKTLHDMDKKTCSNKIG